MNSTSNCHSATSGKPQGYNYMPYRIHKILLVCCSYDGYILEEDGHIELQINREYADLSLSNPPSFTRVSSTKEALEVLRTDTSFDFVLTMYNIGEPDVFTFAKMAKELQPELPITLLTSFSRDIYSRIAKQDCSAIDSIFCWLGNTDIIIGIIKLMEDQLNAQPDIEQGGTQAILLVEDSIRFYSAYLPELYKLILKQNSLFLKDAYNEQQQILRKRARPKILLATCYDQAIELYEKYKKNLLGVISDVGFVEHRNDPPHLERSDIGLELCRHIKADSPLMPVLLQSSQVEFAQAAKEMGAGFVAKNSKRLLSELTEFIDHEFAFGDLILHDPETGAEVGKAKDLREMQELISRVPDHVFEYYTSQNKLSKWLYSRGLFPVAAAIRSHTRDDYQSIEEHRTSIVSMIKDYRTLLGQGVIAQFDVSTYSDSIAFARIGTGSIGGKARGLAFMNTSVINNHLYDKYEGVRVMIPRSIVIATDFFDDFIRINNLEYILSQDISDEAILSEFISSSTPHGLQKYLRAYIRTIDSPLAIRSSSKLEDSHYQPFAGIYSTYMIPYVKNEDQMLRMLLNAIKSVYASVYFAASRSYIASSQNMLSEEKMAVLIQQVVGTQQEDLFLPTFSGVARSINFYPIGDETASEGICKVAMGLGKLVVEGGRTLRFSPAHPKKVLQTSTPELAMGQTQKNVYALSLRSDEFRASISDDINLKSLSISDISKLNQSRYLCSTWDRESGRLSDSPFDKGRKIITFNSILKYEKFPLARIVSDILHIGAEELRCPVEIEFAVNMDVAPTEKMIFNILQIRPIVNFLEQQSIDWNAIDTSKALLYATSALGTGEMEGISDIIYVKEESFNSLITEKIAAELLTLNEQMRNQNRNYILVGPGRWGSSDPFLGVPVSWGHISEAKVIVERAIDGFDIEPSQGTHFFQNVTSLGVGYITLDSRHGDDRLDNQRLGTIQAESEGEYLRLVHFEQPLWVFVDGVTNKAIVSEQRLHKDKQ